MMAMLAIRVSGLAWAMALVHGSTAQGMPVATGSSSLAAVDPDPSILTTSNGSTSTTTLTGSSDAIIVTAPSTTATAPGSFRFTNTTVSSVTALNPGLSTLTTSNGSPSTMTLTGSSNTDIITTATPGSFIFTNATDHSFTTIDPSSSTPTTSPSIPALTNATATTATGSSDNTPAILPPTTEPSVVTSSSDGTSGPGSSLTDPGSGTISTNSRGTETLTEVSKTGTEPSGSAITAPPSTILSPSITQTTLPPGAVLITVTGTTYTEPLYITTTYPGDNHPTLVPVIIPSSGPPVVCFSCLPSFPPPNIEINTPKFCVRILGLSISKCPKNDEPSVSPSREPEKTTQQSNTEDSTSTSTTEGSTSTSQASLCTATVVATYTSVFCSVTVTAGGKKQRRQEGASGCSRTACTTATGCSLSNSVTTTTSTTQARVTHPPCEAAICGPGACSSRNKKRQVKRGLVKKRGNPDQGEWTDPSDYDSPAKFMAGEIFEAYHGVTVHAGEMMHFASTSDADPERTTSNTLVFRDKVVSLAVQGLYGCTSVVIVSKRGVYANHIWEPGFTGSDQNFQRRAIDEMHRGDGSALNAHGLDELRNNPGLADGRGIIFGDNTDADDKPDLHAFIMAPRPRMELFDAQYNPVPDAERQDPNANAGHRAFQDRVDQIKADLGATFGPGLPVEVIEYSPKVLSWGDLLRRSNGQMQSVEVAQKLGDGSHESPRGKLLVQYRPATSCEGPAWRVWIEDRALDGRTATWEALPGQQSAQGGQQRRQACSAGTAGPGTTTRTGDTTATSESAPATASTTTAKSSGAGTVESSSTTAAESSSTPEPPPPPTTTAQPQPIPSEAVYIEYRQSVLSTEGAIAMGGMWLMFPKKMDGASISVCDTATVGHKLADGDISLKSVPQPPDFGAKGDVFGRKGCQYLGGGDGTTTFGRFKCDGVDAFDCIRDEQSHEEFECGVSGGADTYVPRARCLFPVT